MNAQWRTDTRAPTRRAHIHKGTEVLRLSCRWNLEKWKCCICILICSQSGIVFGVAAKLPGVCSSSLFIGVRWETGPKFKSACYHSVWRWGFLFPPPSLCLRLCLPLSLTLCSFSLSIFPHFFPRPTSIFNYISLLLSRAPSFFFFFFVFTLPSLSPPVSPHLAPPVSHCHGSEYLDFISDAVCYATRLWRAPGVVEARSCTALIICPPPPNRHLCQPFDILHPPSIRSFRSNRL